MDNDKDIVLAIVFFHVIVAPALTMGSKIAGLCLFLNSTTAFFAFLNRTVALETGSEDL